MIPAVKIKKCTASRALAARLVCAFSIEESSTVVNEKTDISATTGYLAAIFL
jgi:hypothetical protein